MTIQKPKSPFSMARAALASADAPGHSAVAALTGAIIVVVSAGTAQSTVVAGAPDPDQTQGGMLVDMRMTDDDGLTLQHENAFTDSFKNVVA